MFRSKAEKIVGVKESLTYNIILGRNEVKFI